MLAILPAAKAHKVRRGKFNIDIVFPGLALHNPEDARGLAQLGRFDFAQLLPGVFVGMHMHQNDEILSYLRSGTLQHEDSSGEKATLSNRKLMMMNAGSGFYHQEQIPENGESVRMLQIFVRPERENETPKVQFHEFDEAFSINQWRLIAGHKQTNAPLEIRSKVRIFDARFTKDQTFESPTSETLQLLFVFSGCIELTDGTLLAEGDSLVFTTARTQFKSTQLTDLVLFELNENADYIRNGMFSGT